jgi:hypothetical protein
MDERFLKQVVGALSTRPDLIRFDDGLSDREVEETQRHWMFTFPPDLRQLLQFALPVTPPFPDWRQGDPAEIQKQLDWPVEGICFDVEHNSFWLEAWGSRPADIEEAKAAAREEAAGAPKLIPVYGHRYLPSEPPEEGNPVLSVQQSDIIYYGENLKDYIQNEFWASFGRTGPSLPENVRTIPFWSGFVEEDA